MSNIKTRTSNYSIYGNDLKFSIQNVDNYDALGNFVQVIFLKIINHTKCLIIIIKWISSSSQQMIDCQGKSIRIQRLFIGTYQFLIILYVAYKINIEYS